MEKVWRVLYLEKMMGSLINEETPSGCDRSLFWEICSRAAAPLSLIRFVSKRYQPEVSGPAYIHRFMGIRDAAQFRSGEAHEIFSIYRI